MSKKWCSVLALAAFCVWRVLGQTEIEVLTSKSSRCSYEYAYDMYGAHCAGLRLEQLPRLKSSIEILDFSDNKLTGIEKDTFSSYTNLKFLYLSDNSIVKIEDEAFIYLTDLETLDLKKNILITFPPDILQLPSLRNLYLAGNSYIKTNIYTFARADVIRAPLERLDISNCNLELLPEWGLLPQLLYYNISNNPLQSLDPKHFALMCNLGKVDMTKSIDYIGLCSLRPAISWIQNKNIKLQLEESEYFRLNSREFEKCPLTDIVAEHNETFNHCKSEYLQFVGTRTSRRTWLTISGGLAGFLVGFILLLYLMHRTNVARTKSAAEKSNKAKPDGDKNAAVVLLDDVS